MGSGGAADPAGGTGLGAARLLPYFLSFLLTKVRRSIAVTTPNTICFIKELPFPLTVSTENANLVGKRRKQASKEERKKSKQNPQPYSGCALIKLV